MESNLELFKVKVSHVCVMDGVVFECDCYCRKGVIPLGGRIVKRVHFLLLPRGRTQINSVAELLSNLSKHAELPESALFESMPFELAEAISSLLDLGVVPDRNDPSDIQELKSVAGPTPVLPSSDGKALGFGVFITDLAYLKRYYDEYRFEISSGNCVRTSRREV